MKLFSLFHRNPQKKKSIFRLWTKIILLLLCFNLSLTFLDTALQSSPSQDKERAIAKEEELQESSFGPIQKAYAIEKAEAATTKSEPASPASTDKSIKETIAEVGAIILSIFVPFIAIFTQMIGWLMGNEVVFGTFYSSSGATDTSTVVPILEILHSTWVIFRDIMNYIFIFILLVIAFMNVVNPLRDGGDNYALKTMLPKLIVAIVAINFTWFGAQFILTVSDVAARIVFALPETVTSSASLGAGGKKTCEIKDITVEQGDGKSVTYKDMVDCTIKKVVLNFDKESKLPKEGEGNKDKVIDYGLVTIYWEDFDYSKFNKNSVASMYAFNIMRVQNLVRTAPGETQDWSTLTINVIASLVIMIVVLIVFFTMVVALFLRIVILWVNIIFSPFLGLVMFKDVFDISSAAEGSEDIGVGAFVKNAFLPAMMGIPLSLGFILINTGKAMIETNIETSDINGTMTIEFAGSLINGVSNIHQVFWYALSIVFLWMSVPIAEKSNKLAGSIIGPIKSAAEGFGSFIAKSPMYLNFIPIYQPGGDPKPASAQNILDLFESIPANMRAEEQRKNPLLPREQTIDQRVTQTFASNALITNEINAIKGRAATDPKSAKMIWDTIKTLPVAQKNPAGIKSALTPLSRTIANLSGDELKTAVLAIAKAADPSIVDENSESWKAYTNNWN